MSSASAHRIETFDEAAIQAELARDPASVNSFINCMFQLFQVQALRGFMADAYEQAITVKGAAAAQQTKTVSLDAMRTTLPHSKALYEWARYLSVDLHDDALCGQALLKMVPAANRAIAHMQERIDAREKAKNSTATATTATTATTTATASSTMNTKKDTDTERKERMFDYDAIKKAIYPSNALTFIEKMLPILEMKENRTEMAVLFSMIWNDHMQESHGRTVVLNPAYDRMMYLPHADAVKEMRFFITQKLTREQQMRAALRMVYAANMAEERAHREFEHAGREIARNFNAVVDSDQDEAPLTEAELEEVSGGDPVMKTIILHAQNQAQAAIKEAKAAKNKNKAGCKK
jgi:hypothetical protein